VAKLKLILAYCNLDRTGQDRTGQDRTGQDRTGQDRTGTNAKRSFDVEFILLSLKKYDG
jgi:hypothetical protein